MSVVKQVLDIRRYQQYIKPHQQRIKADAGSLVRDDRAKEFFDVLKQIGIYDSCKLAISPDFGIKTRVSGSNTFVSKGYSLVVPQARYGPELVVNGSFDSSGLGWNKQSLSEISNGVGRILKNIDDSYIYQNIGLVIGKRYLLTFDVVNIVSGSNLVVYNSGGATILLSLGKKSILFSPQSAGNLILGTSNTIADFSIDNISVVEVLNSLDGSPTDVTQTTSTSQPHLGNTIAPNERPSLKNPNGQANYLTHPKISFTANEAWSVTTVFNSYTFKTFYYSAGDATQSLFGGNGLVNSLFLLFSGSSYYFTYDFSKYTGKNIVVTYSKSSNGNISAYINGTLVGTAELNPSSIDFRYLFVNDVVNSLKGLVYSHIIHSQALTPTQVAQLSNYLMSKYPEIPSVTIGSQVWATSNCEMVSTPMGNLISNVTANGNVEKITNVANREFSSDTGNWEKNSGTTWSIHSGVLNGNAENSWIKLPIGFTDSSKYYRVKYDAVVTSGLHEIYYAGVYSGASSATGTKIYYMKGTGSMDPNIYISPSNFTGTIDNVSVQEVGWSDAINLYDYIYANTSGTAEVKTYAAVKAAAMWCYFDNDAALGAIYGKLYNWYAVKLLQMDIDYYNAANPSTPWGYRVPTDTDFNTLATTLGGASVAGGKMKVAGTTYFKSPNAGADNSSGFSAIAGGYREGNGVFYENTISARFWSISNLQYLLYNTNLLNVATVPLSRGHSLRLIKS